VRVVLDANVLVSALIAKTGPPRRILEAWTEERFELVASPALLRELRDVLERPTLRRWVPATIAAELIDGLNEGDNILQDPPAVTGLSPDPDDDYLITLARAAEADYIISGDHHLLDLTDPHPRCSHRKSSSCSSRRASARTEPANRDPKWVPNSAFLREPQGELRAPPNWPPVRPRSYARSDVG
jgi:uncharacterized protein